MLAIVATIKVKAGMESQFEGVAKQLVAKVNANEPGCKLYALHKGDQPLTYIFLERYVDEAATKAHRASDHFRDLGKQMGAFMDGPPQMLRLTEV
jgi:quinol monooxygenase YgiN